MKTGQKAILITILLLALASSASATTCQKDINCPVGQYCSEAVSPAVCASSPIVSDYNSTSIDCTSDSDCVGIGIGRCDTHTQMCRAGMSVGESCRQDSDCPTAGEFCVGSICTQILGNVGSVPCTSDTNCAEYDWGGGLTCIRGTISMTGKFCRAKGALGAYCERQSDCNTGLICDTNYVCAQCPKDNGFLGTGENAYPSGYYCNTTNTLNGSLLKFWSPASAVMAISDKSVGILTLKGQTGDPCIDDDCCATSKCENGRCVGATDGSVPTWESNFCSNASKDLTANWFDGASSDTSFPDMGFFRGNFARPNLKIIKPYNAVTRTLDSESFWFRGTEDGLTVMAIWFYDTSSNEICTFIQNGADITWECGAGGVTGTSYNATHELVTGSIFVNGGDYITQSSGVQTFAGGANGSVITFFNNISKTKMHKATTMGVGSLGTTSNVYYLMKNGAGGAIKVPQYFSDSGAGATAIQIGAAASYNRDGVNYAQTWAITNEPAVSTAGGWWLPYYTHYFPSVTGSPTAGGAVSQAYSWRTTFFSGEYKPTPITCCSDISDCPAARPCCVSGACAECISNQSKPLLVIKPSSGLATQIVCKSTDYTYTLGIYERDSQGRGILIHPSGTIYTNVTGGGHIDAPASCGASGNPCTFTYTSRATNGIDAIHARYTGDSTHNYIVMPAFSVTAQDNCHYLDIYVIDSTTLKPIQNVRINVVSNAIQTGMTDVQGYFALKGLAANSVQFTLSKNGYTTLNATVYSSELDRVINIQMNPIGATPNNLTKWNEFTAPNGTEDVLKGLKNMTFSFFGFVFNPFMFFILFLLAIGAIKIVISAVLS